MSPISISAIYASLPISPVSKSLHALCTCSLTVVPPRSYWSSKAELHPNPGQHPLVHPRTRGPPSPSRFPVVQRTMGELSLLGHSSA